jgi:hypothetical protein
MRLWSLHPDYLDGKGLVALWREGLLARAVLLGKTVGYRHHPQLERFRAQPAPVAVLDRYLLAVYEEAVARGYHFDRGKIGPEFSFAMLEVTDGQLIFELQHLRRKLQIRDPGRYAALMGLAIPRSHPSFVVVAGPAAGWERGLFS